jgi:Yip1-like protein
MTDGPTTPPPAGGPPGPRRSLVDRAKSILTAPAAEWPVIGAEPATVGGLITGYALILAAIAPVAMLIGMFLTPYGGYIAGAPGFLIRVLLVIYGISLGTVVLLGFAINLLAPNLGGTANGVQAMKLAVYSGTAFWVAALVLILPSLWILWLLLGIGYGGYLLWLGLPVLMRVPPDKAQTFTAAAIGIWVVLFLILQQIGWRIIFSGLVYGL